MSVFMIWAMSLTGKVLVVWAGTCKSITRQLVPKDIALPGAIRPRSLVNGYCTRVARCPR